MSSSSSGEAPGEGSRAGIRTVRWAFLVLAATGAAQIAIYQLADSVSLLAAAFHNLGDAFSAVPLWIAFRVQLMPPSERFPYGRGRFEDLAGLAILCLIFLSGALSLWTSAGRLVHPEPVGDLPVVAVAAVVGYLGNELCAQIRWRTARKIGSVSLEADAWHSRLDGLTNLAVLGGVAGIAFGFPLADPLVGLGVTGLIFLTLFEVGRPVLLHLTDAFDPKLSEEIRQSVRLVPRVRGVSSVRARWVGHRILADLSISVDGHLTMDEGHAVAVEVRHTLLHHLPNLADAMVHVDPTSEEGPHFHSAQPHAHDGLDAHAH